jgi:alpha-beta hydrolase superfamily lysophospholipase
MMLAGLTTVARRLLEAAAYSAVGALVVLVGVFIVYMDRQPELDIWHTTVLDEEFTASSEVETFPDYLALEERLFAQLETEIYAKIPADEHRLINRYHRGSLSDPARWSPNWNRSFELAADQPKAGVLLLHGMSDSPYSLHSLGQQLNDAGALVVGLRVPGHGTAPSGLVEVTWQDMAAAVRLAMHHLAAQSGTAPLYLVGYSNGAALAVHYTLETLQDETLPKVERLALLSPEIGVASVAALAVWQARIGHLLGLDKLAWNAILPEYDPYKYGSFAVNAGDVAYRLTNQIQKQLDRLSGTDALDRFPPLLAFSSVVDATVSTPALVSGLFERLPNGDNELVLFDINRMAEIEPLMRSDPIGVIQALKADPDPGFTLTLVTNKNARSREAAVLTKRPGQTVSAASDLGLAWPEDLYSLAHVALPFPPDDPLYGGHPTQRSPGIRLGDVALRGERGVLQIAASDMLRLRWNPFYPYVESRVMAFFGLSGE